MSIFPISVFHMRPFRLRYFLLLALVAMGGCTSEVSTNRDAAGNTPAPNQSRGSSNDDFFNANRMYLDTTLTDSLTSTDTQDLFFIQLPLRVYRTYEVSLTNLTGNADLELYNAYLNRDSWSENSGLEDETIGYWRNYTDLDNNMIYVKVINRSGGPMDYQLSVAAK